MVKVTKSDKVFGEIVRSLGYCERCQKQPPVVQLQTAHIISRRYAKTKTDFRNAFCLCAGCHRFFTEHPRNFSHFISDTWAAPYYDEVYALAHDPAKMDWEERHEFLLDARKQFMAGEVTVEELREFDRTYWLD